MDILSMLGFGGRTRRRSSKGARLKKLNRKLDKKIAEDRLQKKINSKKKRLGMY